jgi:hypothetical protein
MRHPVQQHLTQQEIQITGLSSNCGTLKVATVVQEIMTEHSEAVSGKDKIMAITKSDT